MTLQRDLVRAALALALVVGALSSLTRVFSDGSWMAVTAGAAVLAVAIAAAVRALGFGVAASVAASLVGLATFVYTQHLGPGPLLPGPDQLREATDLFRVGLAQFRDEPAPTPPLDGLLLITSVGAWVVAFGGHELLVRRTSLGLALLPAGVLWAVPLAVPLPPGRTWPQALPFAAAAALMLLLEGDRDVVADRGAGRAGRATLVTGGLLAGLSLLVAAVAPAILPGYGDEAWVDLSGGPDPRGYQPIVDIGDRLKLPEPADILEVRADRKVYLRLAALDSFDGTTWKVGPADQATFQPSEDALFPADGQLPREVPIGTTVPLEVEVEVLDLENIYVPVPYQPVRLRGDAVDDMVYSTEGGFVAAGRLENNEIGGREASGIRTGTIYTVESVLPAADYATLAAVDFSPAFVARWTTLPRDYQQLAFTAFEVYEAAGATTAIDRAFALQEWFTGPESDFRYSLDVDALRGDAALEEFLYGTRTGYCEYYATAMAVMLRATGIPARVAVGFLAGRMTQAADPAIGRLTNTYLVSTSDAHAWVEVLFPGQGWIRFDPTPRSDGAIQQPSPDDLDPLLTEREQLLEDLAADAALDEDAELAEPDTIESERDLQQLDDRNVGPTGIGGAGSGVPWALAVLALVVALVVVPAVRFGRHRDTSQLAPGDRVRLAQRRVLEHAAAYGVPRHDHETGRELARRWIAEGRVEPSAAERFTALVEAAAFGEGVDSSQADQAESIADVLVDGLRGSVDQRQRLLAPWQPSLLRARQHVAGWRDQLFRGR